MRGLGGASCLDVETGLAPMPTLGVVSEVGVNVNVMKACFSALTVLGFFISSSFEETARHALPVGNCRTYLIVFPVRSLIH